MSDESNKTAIVIFGCIGILALMVIEPIWSGFVLAVLWRWFIVAAFNLPPLSLPAAIGVCLVVGYTAKADVAHLRNSDENSADRLGKLFGLSLLKPLVALVFGWIVSFWM